MSEIKMYFRGDSDIKKPLDLEGIEISEGDILTRDFADWTNIKETYKIEPFYKVKINDNGGYYAESLEPSSSVMQTYFYLHDFRFKFCVKLS